MTLLSQFNLLLVFLCFGPRSELRCPRGALGTLSLLFASSSDTVFIHVLPHCLSRKLVA
jgi:hypothetical protein